MRRLAGSRRRVREMGTGTPLFLTAMRPDTPVGSLDFSGVRAPAGEWAPQKGTDEASLLFREAESLRARRIAGELIQPPRAHRIPHAIPEKRGSKNKANSHGGILRGRRMGMGGWWRLGMRAIPDRIPARPHGSNRPCLGTKSWISGGTPAAQRANLRFAPMREKRTPTSALRFRVQTQSAQTRQGSPGFGCTFFALGAMGRSCRGYSARFGATPY